MPVFYKVSSDMPDSYKDFKKSFIKKMKPFEVPHFGRHSLSVLKNPDLEPMPISRRLWGFWSYFGYWAVPNVSVFTYSIGSSLLSLGLNIQNTIGAITIGNILIILYTCFSAKPGSIFKIGYTVCQRMLFGIYGSALGIIIRIMLSIVYFASQSWLGGLGVVVMLSSWSKGYMDMKNTFSLSVPMTTRDFIAFLLFNIIEYFFFFIRPEKMGPLVNGSCFITLIAMFGVFGHELHKCYALTGGPGSMWYESNSVKSSEVGWTWLQAITIFYGAVSPNCTNMSDYSRFSKSPKQMYWGIILSIMLSGMLVPIMGMVTASNTQENYGEAMWLPTDVCLRWMKDNYSSGTRAASFFCGLAFASSQLTFNVLANGFAGGMDLSAVCPRYINIFRGAIITALVSWVCQPWTFYNTASAFNNTMASFGVVMSPIMGLLVSDFCFVRKKRVRVSNLFTLDKNGDFYFFHGVNWRSISCFFLAVIPGMPGLAATVNTNIRIPIGLMHYFQNSTVFSFFCPLILYYILCRIFPLKNAGTMDPEDYFDVMTEKELQKLDMRPFSGDPAVIESASSNMGSIEMEKVSAKVTVEAAV